MKCKTRKTVTGILISIVSLVICISAIAKLIAITPLVEIYSGTGLLPYLRMLGAAELIFMSLFLTKPFRKVGFLLLTSYYGGAVAIELSFGTPFIIPVLLLILVWIVAYLRDASLFITNKKQPVTGNPF